MAIHKGIQTDKWISRQTDRQTERHSSRQVGRQAGRQAGREGRETRVGVFNQEF